ncbi:hypothetical protein CKAN_02666500 [Cinnamomum micranthum f. kanehirae]|uniref:Uncharacterized protein n=1 Tax=Cinnamomum micranthum f. kanehirae TaxID=337451 RepID=A0A3S3PAS9_9MAGN|nr:hypothetical protein CKAN_02666500 [Cinnamomum micranthum f. kanehirae]
MSKNALEQVRDTVVRLEETADGLSETIADHITHGLKIVVLTEKVVSLEMSLAKVVAQIEELKSTTYFFKEQMESFSDELTLFKRAIRTNGSATDNMRFKVPEPKPFDDTRNAKELENFLWDMEQIKSYNHQMYLSGDVKLWWRTRVDDDLSAGRVPITT